MPEPLRSPKQSRVAAKNRSHPYARPANGHRVHDAGLQRSNSLLGSIKSFVTAPLAWLSLSDSQQHDDSSQKRRVSGSERGGTPPKAKRARRDSPDGVGYLDPPDSLFVTAKPTLPLLSHANGVAPTRTMSIDSSRPSSEPYKVPQRLARGHSILSQTSMSMEPQGSSVIRRSTTRDLSMPPPSPFARSFSRSSLTPQPAGATFGPSPKRKQRDSTAPPLLGPSTPTPSFTRPPPSTSGQQSLFPRALSRERSEGPISALLARSTLSVSPTRESPSRSMLIRDEVHMSSSQSKNTAERTLSRLESFRTPLHISRFPSAPPLVAEHQPRKVHVPMPSKLRFDHTPEGRKDKARRTPMIIGPYSSGLSGMRKLLARRREEIEKHAETEGESEPAMPESSLSEEVEMEYEKSSDKGRVTQAEAEAEAEDSGVSRTLRPQANGTFTKADAPLVRARSPSRLKGDGLSSTLRTPSSRVSRTHAPAPKLKKARNKFSLNDDDEEPEWSMSVEEVKDYQAQIAKAQPPITFGATRSMSEAGMQTDMDAAPVSHSASPPPLPAQPQTFDSLLSRIDSPAPAAARPTAEFPASQEQPKPDARPDTLSPAATESSSAPATLPFSLGAPTTVIPKPAEDNPSPFASKAATPVLAPAFSVPSPGPGGVPAFFAKSKAQFTPPKVPSGSLFGSPPANDKKDEEPKNVFAVVDGAAKEGERDESQSQKATKPSPFGGLNKPSMFGGSSTSAFGGEPLREEASTRPPPSPLSPFGGFGNTPANKAEETSKCTFGAPTANGQNMSKPGISIFGAASKPDATPSSTTDVAPKPAFAFGAPPPIPTPSTNKPDIRSSTPASDASSKPAFSFGAPAPAPSPSAEPLKMPLSFGSSASIQSGTLAPEALNSPFSFGAAPSTPPPADKKPVGTFTFGNTAASTTSGFSFGSTAAPNGSTNVSKPAFSGFGNVAASTTNRPKTPELAPAEGGDGMEMNGDRMEESPTRSVEKKDVLASQFTQSSSFAGFGGGGGGGFSFGQDKTAAPSGSFSFGQPKPLPSTGTGFTFGQTTDKSTTGSSTSSGFTFGNDASKNAGQSQPPFGAPVNNPFGGTASNSTNSRSFSFGQPSTGANPNPFGQPQQPENTATTTPSSPSLFSQPAALQPQPTQQSPSFSFTAQSGNPFSSPATGAATPSSPTIQPFQFGASGSAQPQPQAQAGAASNTMFTLGGAATPPPRRVKGLPTRRGTKRS